MELTEQLEELLVKVGPRAERIIRLRFGLDDGQSLSLTEVGKLFCVTRERIRQIERKALCWLRHPSHHKLLREYLPTAISKDIKDLTPWEKLLRAILGE